MFQKRNKILRIARAKPSRKQNQIVSKKKQNPNKCMGKSLRGSEAKLFQKRNKTSKNARAKPSRSKTKLFQKRNSTSINARAKPSQK
jgi:hypothetical protein